MLALCNVLLSSNGACEDIRIGALFSLSGYAALAGQDELDGVTLAVEELNDDARFAERKIRLFIEDNRSEKATTAAAIKKLIGVDGVSAIVGPNWAEFAEVAAPIAQLNGIPLVTPSGWSKNLTRGREYVFSALEGHPIIVKPLVDYIVEQRPKEITAFVAANEYFESLYDSILQNLSAHSLRVNKLIRVSPTETDFRSALLQLKARDCDVVLNLLAEGVGLSSFYKQVRELKVSAKIFSGNSISFDHGNLANLNLANGTVFVDYVDASTEAFKRRFNARFKRDPLPTASRAFDVMKAVAESALMCGTSGVRMRGCLTNVSFDGASGPFSFNIDRNFRISAPPSRVYEVRDGRIVPQSLLSP